MSFHRGWVALLIVGFGGSLPAADSPGDLAIQARSILKKHCAECHDGQASNRSSLSVMDYSQLVNPDRKLPAFVKSKTPLGSQIVQFMEEGSMPPGDRPRVSAADIAIVKSWINEGAVAYPAKFDSSFAYAAILADVKSLPDADRKSYRYFTLNHLVEEDKAGGELAKMRDSFRQTLNSVSRKELDSLKGVDATNLIFRVDIRETGWGTQAFRQLINMNGKTGDIPSTFTIFDYMLLEYPLGEMPPATKDAEALAELWLRPISQIRPVSYVHADWFAKALDGTPLKADIRRLLELGAKARGINAPENKALDFRPEDLPAINVRPTTKTIPIVPIDAMYLSDYEPKPPAPKVELTILNGAGKQASKFKPGDKLKMELRSSDTVYVELVQIEPNGAVYAHGGGRVQANVQKELEFGDKTKELVLGDLKGKQRFILFAGLEQFPEVELLESTHDREPMERYVHRFYELPKKIGDPLKFDPSKMARKTAIITVE